DSPELIGFANRLVFPTALGRPLDSLNRKTRCFGRTLSRRSETKPSVNTQHLPGEITGVVAREKGNDAGNFLGLADAAQGDGLLDSISGQVSHRQTHVGFD